MPTGSDYDIAIVIVNRHEPEGETAARLMEIAADKGYDSRVVEAQRGEHDSALSFRVPEDVAEAFNADRADRWPADKIENDDEKRAEQERAGVDGDAYAADQTRRANTAREANAAEATEDDDTNTPGRKTRPGKAKE